MAAGDVLESDTGYDTRRRVMEGVLARVSQTAVYDTCGSVTPASRRRTAPSRWTCSATRYGPRASTPATFYHDFASGVRDDRPGLDSCVRALRTGDVLVVQGRHIPIVEQDRPSGSRLRAASPDSGAAGERLGGGRAVRADAPVWALLLARGSRPRHRMTTSPARSRRYRTAPATLARVHHRVADARMAPHRGRQRAAV